MYQSTQPVPVVAGVAALPNTGGNELVMALAVISIAVGVLVLATSAARIVAKRVMA